MVLNLYGAALHRVLHKVSSALLHKLCDSLIAAHILIASAALCAVGCGALCLMLGSSN